MLAVLEPLASDAAPIVPPEPEPETTAPAAPTVPDLDTLQAEEASEPPASQDPAWPEAQDPARNMSGNIPEPSRPPAIMRPIAALDLGDVIPRDLADEEGPKLLEVDPRDLMVDETYQRDSSAKSLALIRRIVENWSWSKYKAPNCVWVGDQLHVVDGQHTAIAAASHPGIEAIFVLVSTMPEVADRAGAFLSHAQNRLPATHLQIHRAAVTAGDADPAEVVHFLGRTARALERLRDTPVPIALAPGATSTKAPAPLPAAPAPPRALSARERAEAVFSEPAAAPTAPASIVLPALRTIVDRRGRGVRVEVRRASLRCPSDAP